MTFSQHLVLWLHVAFVIFTIGPVTLAVMSTPRYIRKRDAQIVRYLSRITVVFTVATLGVLVAGLFLAQMLGAIEGLTDGARTADGDPHEEQPEPVPAQQGTAQVATVERGRIAMTGGVVGLIWLVILVLMVWNA